MGREVTKAEAAKTFTSLIDAIGEIEEARIVDDAGEMVAIILSPEAYRQGMRDRYWAEVDRASWSSPDAVHISDQDREAAWQRFWAAVDRIQERNADKDPDEVYRDVTEVVEEVRRERYERERTAVERRRRHESVR
jgi:hypothetical protein